MNLGNSIFSSSVWHDLLFPEISNAIWISHIYESLEGSIIDTIYTPIREEIEITILTIKHDFR